MKKNNFWFISLIALVVISCHIGLSIPLRVTIGANAIVVLIDVIYEWRVKTNGKEA